VIHEEEEVGGGNRSGTGFEDSGLTTMVADTAMLWGPAVLGARPDQQLKILWTNNLNFSLLSLFRLVIRLGLVLFFCNIFCS